MIDNSDCGAVGGMKIGRRNRSTRRKPAPVPLCPPQIPHNLTRIGTPAAAVGETSRFPHFVHNRLTDGGEVVSLTRRPAALYSQEGSWYSFLLEAESTPGP
jgi:hypothetical protein